MPSKRGFSGSMASSARHASRAASRLHSRMALLAVVVVSLSILVVTVSVRALVASPPIVSVRPKPSGYPDVGAFASYSVDARLQPLRLQPNWRQQPGRPSGVPLVVVAAAASAPQATPEVGKGLFEELFGAEDQRPVVLYDGVCNMCNKAVDTAMQRDPEGRRLRFAALQTSVGAGLLEFCGRSADDLSSMIVVRPDGVCLTRSDAALFVGKQLEGSVLLRGASEVASRLLPQGLRDAAYDTIAANRYKVLGKRDELRVSQEGMENRFVGDGAVAGA